jgi:hypothetical protein
MVSAHECSNEIRLSGSGDAETSDWFSLLSSTFDDPFLAVCSLFQNRRFFLQGCLRLSNSTGASVPGHRSFPHEYIQFVPTAPRLSPVAPAPELPGPHPIDSLPTRRELLCNADCSFRLTIPLRLGQGLLKAVDNGAVVETAASRSLS